MDSFVPLVERHLNAEQGKSHKQEHDVNFAFVALLVGPSKTQRSLSHRILGPMLLVPVQEVVPQIGVTVISHFSSDFDMRGAAVGSFWRVTSRQYS